MNETTEIQPVNSKKAKSTAIQTIYKDSPLGKIPVDWEVKILGKSGIIIIDGDRGNNYPSESDFLDDGYCLFMNAKNVTNNGFSFIEKSFITKKKDEELRKGKLKRFDLILTTRGTVGNIAFYDSSIPFDHLRINSGMVLIRNENNQIHTDFIYKCFASSLLQNQVTKIAFGSAQPQLTVKEIYKFNFPFPPLSEQLAIATCLSTIDETITKTNQLIAQKELRKKWLMQQLLSGKKRLKGFGWEWKEVKIGDVFEGIKETNDGGDSHSIMTISSKLGLISQQDKFDRVIAGDSLKKYTQLKIGDFAYNKGNSKTYPMGCVYQLEEYQSALVPFVYICFKPSDKISSLFYKQWFNAHGLDRQLQRIITSGARGDGLLNVNSDDFFKLKIPLPPKDEQTAIAQVLQSADKEIQLLKAKADKLKEEKKGMMQVLLTGKKRLKIQ